jgi:hypothetical protein
MKQILEEILKSPWVWSIVGGLICLVLPSPLLKKAGDKVGDAIEEVGGAKTRDTVYEILYDFAQGLKNENHEGNKNLVSNSTIDKKLNSYNMSLGLENSKLKVRE